MVLKPIQCTIKKNIIFIVPNFSSSINTQVQIFFDSYNRFGQQEKNDEHALKTSKFLSSNGQDSYLKNNPYQSNPFLQKIRKALHICLPSSIFFFKLQLVIIPIFFLFII